MPIGDYRSIFSETRALTIAGAFSTFLEANINITRGTRSRASTSHNHLREFLADEAYRDEYFPRVLSVEDSDFLGGSFARHTKIWPLDDIDIYFPLDGMGFNYFVDGSVQPYTVVSDDVVDVNPLLTGGVRWMDGPYLSSKKLINGFAKVLRRHYPDTTTVRRVGEAINVRLTVGEGENNDGFGFDVVPCFSVKPQNAWEQHFYLIPDGEDGWIKTNPRYDKEMSDQLHRANARTLRRGVKLFKWWNDKFLGGAVASYYAELAVMLAFDQKNRLGCTIESVSAATTLAFRAVRDAARLGDQQPLVVGAPMVERGDIDSNDMQLLNEAADQANLAWNHERSGHNADAIKAWSKLFGDDFPTG